MALALIVLAVGSVVPRKAYDVLLQALERVPADPAWQLTIAGAADRSPDTAAALEAQIAANHAGARLVAAAMARLDPLVGRWQGEANLSSPETRVVHQTERVERDLEGLVLVIHGVGYASADHAGTPVFQALAVVSYDDRAGRYEFRTYTGGRTVTATAEFLPDGALRWGFAPGGPVQIRYTIRFDADSWNEIGEMSRDNGATWTHTISMQLTRIP